jgi:ribosomal-protein-alanine N-acetyltransferase
MRGWPVTLTEPRLLDEPITLRPVKVSDARTWREIRVRNAPWLRPWEPTNPETPLYRSSLGPYISMVRAMRREARQGQAVPWVVTFGEEFVGQLTVGSITWGSARSGQVGYWIDEAYAGRGIIPTALAMAVDHCFGVIGLHRLEASIRPENHASRRVVEKLGFREEGVRVRQLHINGAWRDHVCYALTAEEVPHGLMPRWRSVLGASRLKSLRVWRHTGRGARVSLLDILRCVTWAVSLSRLPFSRSAGGRASEQRDTVRRHRRDLGWRAHPPVAAARIVYGGGDRDNRSRPGTCHRS